MKSSPCCMTKTQRILQRIHGIIKLITHKGLAGKNSWSQTQIQGANCKVKLPKGTLDGTLIHSMEAGLQHYGL